MEFIPWVIRIAVYLWVFYAIYTRFAKFKIVKRLFKKLKKNEG